MAYTILGAIAQAAGGKQPRQILPVDVYGAERHTTTSWDVALGIQAAVDNGATVLNLSLGGPGDSSVLDSVIQQAIAAGIPVYAAAGNQPVSTPTYPAATPGVIAVTASRQASSRRMRTSAVLVSPGDAGGAAWFISATSRMSFRALHRQQLTRRAWRRGRRG